MADLEAHPIADVPSEAQQETAKPANEADQAPADAQPPVDVEAAAESPDDAPRHSVLKEIPPQAVSATSPAALPPKAPRTRLPDGQVQARQRKQLAAPQQPLHRLLSSGRFRAKDGNARPRTFTARPPEGCSRHVTRADYTHSESRLVDIARETRSLVTRLERIYGRRVGATISANSPPRGKPCNEAPTEKNRRLLSEKIAAENLRIFNRLQAVKPSKDTAASQLRRDWETAQRYSRNCAVARKMKAKGKAQDRSPARQARKNPPVYVEAVVEQVEPDSSPMLHVTVPSTVIETPAEPEPEAEPEPTAEAAVTESHPIDIES